VAARLFFGKEKLGLDAGGQPRRRQNTVAPFQFMLAFAENRAIDDFTGRRGTMALAMAATGQVHA
jgi:hypothetical protein